MALNKIGTGAAALGLLATASSPTLAESADKTPGAAVQLASYTVEQVDCVTHVKNQRSIRKEAGDPMSRKEMKLMLGACRNANADARLQAQEEIIAATNQRIEALKADSQAKLDQAEAILRALVVQLSKACVAGPTILGFRN